MTHRHFRLIVAGMMALLALFAFSMPCHSAPSVICPLAPSTDGIVVAGTVFRPELQSPAVWWANLTSQQERLLWRLMVDQSLPPSPWWAQYQEVGMD